MKNAYVTAYLFGLQSALEYRMNFILSMLSSAFPIGVQLYIWNAVYRHGGEGKLFGYDYYQIMTYSVLAAVVSKLVISNIENTIVNDIKNGGLSIYLIKPISYFRFRITFYFGQRLMNVGISILIVILLFGYLYWASGIRLEPLRIILFLISLFLSVTLSFVMSFSLSSVAFWLTEITYFFHVTNLVLTIVSGGIFPLEIFGNDMMYVFSLLPFQYTVYYPVNVLNGNIATPLIWTGLIWQSMWIIAFLFIYKITWRWGLKRYLGVGG